MPVTDGRLDLGPWQQVFYTEFDGRRPKRLVIKVDQGSGCPERSVSDVRHAGCAPRGSNPSPIATDRR